MTEILYFAPNGMTPRHVLPYVHQSDLLRLPIGTAAALVATIEFHNGSPARRVLEIANFGVNSYDCVAFNFSRLERVSPWKTSMLSVNLPVFILASLILLLTPGPAVLYIITRSVNQGRRAGLASVLGVELGNLVHVLAATLGLSAVLFTSALAFTIVKYAGAAYLIYLGLRTLLTPIATDVTPTATSKTLRGTFSQGIVVAALNPKTALFFLAFLPQFVDGSKGSVSLQFLFLGLIFVGMGTVTDGTYALLSGTAGGWLRRNIWFARFQRYFAGTVYIGLGLTAALTGNKE